MNIKLYKIKKGEYHKLKIFLDSNEIYLHHYKVLLIPTGSES